MRSFVNFTLRADRAPLVRQRPCDTSGAASARHRPIFFASIVRTYNFINQEIFKFCFLSYFYFTSSLHLTATKMVLMSVLNQALNVISNAERRGKRQVLLRPVSKVVIKFLQVMMKHGYIGEFELVDDRRGGKIVVTLIGRINKTGVISPRFDVALGDIDKWTAKLLPSRQFGLVILTTSYGIMDHEEAVRKHTGGKLLGYVF